jgi:hypothetical protein
MRTVIAGSRSITDPRELNEAVARAAVNHGIVPTTVLSGNAFGVDKMGEAWAAANDVPVETYPANWSRYGNRAGHLRNATMAHQCEAVIAVWDGKSKGTMDMIQLAVGLGKRVFIWQVPSA